METYHPGNLWLNFLEGQYLYFQTNKVPEPFWKAQISHRQCHCSIQMVWVVLWPYRCESEFTDVTPWQWEQNLAKDCWKNLRDSDAHILDFSFHPYYKYFPFMPDPTAHSWVQGCRHIFSSGAPVLLKEVLPTAQTSVSPPSYSISGF